MRTTGFIFLELYTQNLSDYVAFFREVAGFKLIEDKGEFIELRSDAGVLLLNAMKEFPDSHPFRGKVLGSGKGIGVEIGIVLKDLHAAREAALRYTGWSVTDLKLRPWGLNDFRVTTPDGYYLRFTDAFE